MMKRINYLWPIIIFLISGCEKVIEVDLNEANPEVVIEANIFNGEGPYVVKISQTSSYFEPFSEKSVSGAIVNVENEKGHIIQFNEAESGIYVSKMFFPKFNQNYNLRVEINEKIYEASSYMNEPVRINSLISEYIEGRLFFDSGYIIICRFTDPENIENFYRIKFAVNGEEQNGPYDYHLFSDEFFDGNQIEVRFNRQLFNIGDTISLSLMSIDQAIYKYFNTLEEILGSVSARSAAPANPNSNFSNGALGYFSAYTIDTKSIVIKE